MKQWRIPVVWQEYGIVHVTANTLDEAIDIAVGPDTPLPSGDYVGESCEAAYDTEEIRAEWNNGQKDDEI